MGLKKYKLGELIELVEETNSDELFGPNDVRGISYLKEMMSTKADVANTDLRKFLIVHPDEQRRKPQRKVSSEMPLSRL